ncbi:MAG: D-alanyl-D-alanine carboxypeptidase/D-alanyl-D-alanine-endopeptidase [Acidobacteriota bacterium]
MFRGIIAILMLAAATSAFGASSDPGDFSKRLQACAGQFGAQAVDLSTGKVVWEHRARDTFIPASLAKVFTSYAALKTLGPSHQFKTEVWAAAEPKYGVVGPIVIKSDGDIFLTAEKAWTLAMRIRERGVRSVQGVVVDNGYFKPERVCLDEADCTHSYNPMVSGTALEFNTVAFRVRRAEKVGEPVRVEWFPPGDYVDMANLAVTGPKNSRVRLKIESMGATVEGREKYRLSGKIPVGSTREYEYHFNAADPAVFAARSFEALLRQVGVEVKGEARGGEKTVTDAGRVKLATFESAPLSDLIYGLNRYSNNFMAEMLVRDLGAQVFGPPGTIEKGVAVVKRSVSDLGLSDGEVLLDSGSGLSRKSRVSPQALCRVLAGVYRDSSIAPEFLASLAVGGRDGTLKKRLGGSTVRGKTGTLGDVVGFAGYVSGERPYAVVIMMNEVKNLFEAREALDSILESLPSAASGHNFSTGG